jgi:hypothetical protein
MTLRDIQLDQYGIIIHDDAGNIHCLSAEDALEVALWILQQRDPLMQIVTRMKRKFDDPASLANQKGETVNNEVLTTEIFPHRSDQ